MLLKRIYLFSLLLALLSIISCTKEDKKILDLANIDIKSMPSIIGDSIETLVSDSGKVNYMMKAPKLAIYDKVDTPYWDFPQGLVMTTYDPKGIENGEIKSKFAIYHMEKELWELRKQVEAKNPDGKMIETELLYWDQKTHTIYSDTFVKVTEDDMITKGYGFTSDETFENWALDDFEVEYTDNK